MMAGRDGKPDGDGVGGSDLAIRLLTTSGCGDYRLIDCGKGRKLERFGSVVVDRPEPQAMWLRRRSEAVWSEAHAVFSASGDDEEKGKWRIDRPVAKEGWPVTVDGVTMSCRMQGLWHLGLFPEQAPHWAWLVKRVEAVEGRPARVLNLFGYTGAASLVAAKAGAEVTHVDASKKAISWARDNQARSGLEAAKIRWIVDDASKFSARDVRRGKTYDVIVVDPPKFGRGPAGEVWDLFTSLPGLLQDLARLLAPGPSALILTAYALRSSSLAFGELVGDVLKDEAGQFEVGELALEAESGVVLPTSLFVRWSRDA